MFENLRHGSLYSDENIPIYHKCSNGMYDYIMKPDNDSLVCTDCNYTLSEEELAILNLWDGIHEFSTYPTAYYLVVSLVFIETYNIPIAKYDSSGRAL